MPRKFILPADLVRELGYLINNGQRRGWIPHLSEMLCVSPRTIESWARGERECEGPSALLIVHFAKMIANGSYLEMSIREAKCLIDTHGKPRSLDLERLDVRRKIRSVIKLHSSINKLGADLEINRSALSRWLSGSNSLGFDSITKVLDHIGLEQRIIGRNLQRWSLNLAGKKKDEIEEQLHDALELLFPNIAPRCLLTQLSENEGKAKILISHVFHEDKALTILFHTHSSFLANGQAFDWLISVFEVITTLSTFCLLYEGNEPSEIDEVLEAVQCMVN